MIINQNFHEMITRKYGVLKYRQLRSPALIFLSLNRAVLPFHRLLKEISIIRQNKHISHYHYANYPVTLNLFSRIFPNLYKFTRTHITAAQSLSFAGKLASVNINREVNDNFYLIDVLPPAAPADVSRAKLLKKFDQNFLLPFGQLAYRHLRCDATLEVNKNFSRYPGLLLEPPIVLEKTYEPLAKVVKEQIIKSFVGSRGGFSKGGWHPQPIHGQPDAVLSGASSQMFAEKTKFHKVLVKGGWHPQPIHGQPDAVLSGASSQKFAEKTKFHKVLVKESLAAGGNFASSSYGMKNMPVENAGATVPDLKHFNPSALVPAHITETVQRLKKNIIESKTITQESSSFSASQQGNAEAEAKGKITVNVGQLTEQVYRMLMHKIKIEKERRGL